MKWTRRKFLVSEVETKKRVPVKRWIVLALILLGVYCAYLGPSILKPVSPTVVLPAEPVWYGSWVTNTILATLITDVLLILLAVGAFRFARSGNLIPSGVYNAFEAIVEFLWNTVEGATGKMAWRIVPVVATIFLLIFVANMVKLVPGFESIGYLEKPHFTSVAYVPVKLFSIGSLPVYAIDPGQSTTYVVDEADHGESTESGHAESEEHEVCKYCHVIPFLRGSATDLNFTFALAVIAVLMTQVYGVMALGPGYFSKFFQFGRLIRGGVFGIIDFGVGFLELILEFAKILSFSFRLFGNIFAGALLLAIVGSLLPVVIPPGLYFFEIFFGMIQAYVFFLLATMFISMALVSHHGDEHAEEHH
jgi:F-type H+-transporting ATPase subunit a